jgi:hypothetical protein
MLKFNYLGLAIASTIALISVNPAQSLETAPDFFCYMQTADGEWINLEQLCAPTIQPKSTAIADPKIVVSSANYDGERLRGTLTNQTGQAVNKVTINYTIIDQGGKEIDSGMITQRVPLAPGASFAFEQVSQHSGATVQIASIDWSH